MRLCAYFSIFFSYHLLFKIKALYLHLPCFYHLVRFAPHFKSEKMSNPFADKPRGMIAEVARVLGVSWPTAEKLLLRGDPSAKKIADEFEATVTRESQEARDRISAIDPTPLPNE